MEPIDWLPWSQEAFRRAEAEQKPVLLSLVTDWCGLSMLMDRTSYVDPQVLELIRDGLIPVKVDADEHPDINERYNVGGWPTTAFLSPEGDPWQPPRTSSRCSSGRCWSNSAPASAPGATKSRRR